MAKSSADDLELKRACEAAVEGSKHKVVLSIRVAKSRGIFGKSAKLVRQMAKARVLAITTKSKGPKTKAFLRVLKHSNGGILEPAKVYKLKHLSKVEVIQNDPSGCTFMLGFDNLRSQSVAPPQWTMRNTDDRNRLLLCILNMSREILDRLPKVVGMDIVEMALWAKENSPFSTNQTSGEYGIATSVILQDDKQVNVEKDLSFEVEEKDMEALLSSYVLGVSAAEEFSERMKRELQALEAANVYSILENETLIEEVLQGLEEAAICVEDMHEWLGIFNVKLKHMREDIESIEARNNKLELHYANSKALVEELDKLLELLHIPPKIEASLKGGSFDESCVVTNIEACEWLIGAICRLQVPNLDPFYANMQAVKEKQLEFEMLKSTFVRRATEFLRNYFSSVVDFLINDQNYFSRRGSLEKPDHSELRFRCRAFARLIEILKSLDRSCLGPLRKAYCHSLNLLLCQEAREFANELHSSTKAVKSSTPWFEFSTGSVQAANGAETAVFSEAYLKMLTVFIPLLVDESSFFAHFMCFDIPTLANVSINGSNNSENVNHDQEGSNGMELTSLNESLHGLFDGFQKEFYSFLDLGFECDPLSCITMHGITERCHSGQKVVETGFIRLLLDDLETRISNNFIKFVDDCIYEIEKTERNNAHQVLPYIPRFALLATRMEQYIQGQSRDLVDQAYTKIISIMFVCLERAAQFDPKYSDIVLLENYAAFQNSIYDLANVVPTLAKFYHQASESYDQACTHHINMVIFITFERLFLFARRIEELMLTIAPEEIQFHVGMSKSDFRKMLKASLSGFEKSTVVMHKKLQKNLTSEWLLPSLWDKCKKGFLDKYRSFVNLVSKIYPGESIPSVSEMRELLAQYK